MQEWTWSKLNIAGGDVTAALNGLHDLDLHMREDGLRIDKVVLTSPSAGAPSGTGPNESSTGTISTNETRTTISYTYDKLYRLTDTEYSGGIVASYGYEYDKVGNMVAYTDTVAAQTAIHTRVFNAMNQMTAEMLSADETQVGVGTKTISYDPNGNMVRIDPAPGSGVPIKFYSYNQRKLMTRAQEQGAELQTVAEFRYDGNNDRLEQTQFTNGTASGTTEYTNDTIGLTQVLVSDGGAGNTVYQLYGNSLIGQQVNGSSQFQTFITDGLGSVRVEMETSGATNYLRTFSPFGETLAENGTRATVYGYTGQQEDESTGLIYLRARYYSAELKAFTAYDVWPGESRRPQSLNHYAYTEGNPIRYFDPSGHCKRNHHQSIPNDNLYGGQYENTDDKCWDYLEKQFCKVVECFGQGWQRWFNVEKNRDGEWDFGEKWWEYEQVKALSWQLKNTMDTLAGNNIDWKKTDISKIKFEIRPEKGLSSDYNSGTKLARLHWQAIGGLYLADGMKVYGPEKEFTVYHELGHVIQNINGVSLPTIFEDLTGNCVGCQVFEGTKGYYWRQYGCNILFDPTEDSLSLNKTVKRRQAETWADAFAAYVYSRVKGHYPSSSNTDLGGHIDDSLSPNFPEIYSTVNTVLNHEEVQNAANFP